jgi:hypothetical protein
VSAPANVDAIKSTIMQITKIFLVEDFIGYFVSLRSKYAPHLNLGFMN